MAELKTKKNDASVKEFLLSVDDQQKQQDAFALLDIFRDATGEQPKMWGSSIIGFGEMPYQRSDGSQHTWMKTGFSPRKQSLTLYIMAGFDEYAQASKYDPQTLLKELGPHKTAKSCLYIKRLNEVDTTVLKKLIKASINALETSSK